MDFVLLDLGENCALRESLAGFEAALRDAGFRYVKTVPGELPRSRAFIVPACVAIPDEVARHIWAQLSAGAAVLIESGAVFADPAEFDAHRKFLWAHLGIQVEPPLTLWPGPAGKGFPTRPGQSALPRKSGALADQHSRVPFVDYTWPRRIKVRDFSRVVPLKEPAGEIIAVIDGRPVAARRKVGKGILIFLGSPLGPAILAGDREARAWLLNLHSVA